MTSRPNKLEKDAKEYFVEFISAAAASTPFCGGLASYIDKYYPSYTQKTLQDLYTCLTEHADEIEYIKCDLNQLGAMLSRLPLEFMKTCSQEKRNAFINILRNFCINSQSVTEEADVFMHLVSYLNEHQVKILYLLKEGSAELPESKLFNDWFPNLTMEALRYICSDLHQKGLINSFEHNLDVEDSPIYISYLSLSNFGNSFVNWISPQKKKQ